MRIGIKCHPTDTLNPQNLKIRNSSNSPFDIKSKKNPKDEN